MTLGKKTKGRKRHLLVDTMGFVIEVLVHSAGIQDSNGGKLLVSKAKLNGATFHKRFGKTVRSWIFLAMTRLMLKRLDSHYASP